jgi:hypothetical protein
MIGQIKRLLHCCASWQHLSSDPAQFTAWLMPNLNVLRFSISSQAVQHKQMLYLALSRYFGDSSRAVIPAVYWAFVQIGSTDLCVLNFTAEGVISSNNGLGFAFPVIAALSNGGARVMYSFSGPGSLPNNLGKAYPGVHGHTTWDGNEGKLYQPNVCITMFRTLSHELLGMSGLMASGMIHVQGVAMGDCVGSLA